MFKALITTAAVVMVVAVGAATARLAAAPIEFHAQISNQAVAYGSGKAHRQQHQISIQSPSTRQNSGVLLHLYQHGFRRQELVNFRMAEHPGRLSSDQS